MSQVPPVQPGPVGTQPHRGVLVLVLGIVGIVLCVIAGIVAWVMGNSDLKDMDAGRMDPSGRGMTQAGKILGIISVALWGFGIVVWLIMFVFAMFAAAAGAAGAGGP